jgi:hypothetical protein
MIRIYEVCTNAASTARDGDPILPCGAGGIDDGGQARLACILAARATSREPSAFLWSAPTQVIVRGAPAGPRTLGHPPAGPQTVVRRRLGNGSQKEIKPIGGAGY